MKRLPTWARWVIVGLVALSAFGAGWYLHAPPAQNPSQSGSSSRQENSSHPGEAVDVDLPPNGARGAESDRQVRVTIPDSIIERLGPPRDSGPAKVLQALWPGVAALLGAVAGGGVTLWANRRKTRKSDSRRKRRVGRRSRIEVCRVRRCTEGRAFGSV